MDTSGLGKVLTAAAWCTLAFIAYATLSPIELRPVVAGIEVEHLAAFAIVGLLFGAAYPRYFILVCVLLIGAAALLETLQLVIPGRHGRFTDFAIKLSGAALGLAAARLLLRIVSPSSVQASILHRFRDAGESGHDDDPQWYNRTKQDDQASLRDRTQRPG